MKLKNPHIELSKLFRRMALYSSILAASFNVSSCGPEDDCEFVTCPCPEEDWEIVIKQKLRGYDDVFPYDGTQKTLTYVYQNGSIDSETMVFRLYDTDTLEIIDKSWEGGGSGCRVTANEVERYYYESDETANGIKRWMRIGREISGVFNCEISSSKGFSNAGYPVLGGRFSNNIDTATIYETYTVLDKEYQNVLLQQRSGFDCDKDSTHVLYSPSHGYIEIVDSCRHEHFSLLDIN